MDIQEQDMVGFRPQEEGVPNTAFETHMREGDRLYARHLDLRETVCLLPDCLNAYARALEEKPDAPEVLMRLARVFLRQGQLGKAERYARKTLQLSDQVQGNDSRSVRFIRREAIYVMGTIQARSGRHAEASASFLEAVRLGGLETCRARISLFQSLRGLAKPEKNPIRKTAILLKSFYALLSAVPLYAFERERLPFVMMMMATMGVLQGWVKEEFNDADGALNHYLNIQRRFPGLASLGVMIGAIYRRKGEGDKALYWFERVLTRHPGHLNTLFHLAKLREQREEYDAMAEIYEQLDRLKPSDPHIHCNLANAYYYGTRFQEALTHYESALHLGDEPQWRSRVAQSIGNILVDQCDNPEAAIASYALAKTLDPTELENYLQLGLLYFQQEDFSNAELIYRQALAIAPDNPRLSSNIGYLRWMEGDIETAVQAYEKAIALDSQYEIPLNNLGVIYLDTLGQVQRAVELFQQAIAVNENYALGYYNLGRAYSFLEQRLEAANCFRVAQNLNRFSCDLDNDELTERINSLFEIT